MAAHLNDFFRLVLEASWQSSLVIVLILLVRPLMGSRIPARWRYSLWALVLIRLLVPISLFPPSPVSMQNIAVVDQPLEQAGFTLFEGAGMERSVRVRQGPDTGGSSYLPLPRARESSISWWSLASAVWLAGAVSVLVVMICAQVVMWRRVGKTSAPVDPLVLAAWDLCCVRLRIRGRPALRVSPDVASPALVGLIRPVLLLPEKHTADFLPEDWENIFVHELAHYRRADHWTHALELAALAVHWFNPLVWLGFRQLRADRELAADEWALQHLGPESSAAYGGTLLKVLKQSSGPSLSVATVGIMEDRAQLKQRLLRIVAFGPRTLIGSLLGFGIVVAVALLVLGRTVEKADMTYYADYAPDELLIKAAQQGDIPVIRKMLDDGADINAIGGYYEQTPLSIAAVADQQETVRFLLSKGADINRKADKGLTPVEDAMANGRSACADMLLAHGAACSRLELAAYKGDMPALKAELDSPQLDLDQAKTSVRIAACNGRVEAFKLFLEKVRGQPGNEKWRLEDREVLTVIARGQREAFLAFLNAPPSWDRGGHGGVVRIGYAASQTPGMRDWLISQGFNVPEYTDGERLIDAAEHEDLPEMDRLLKKGVNVEYLGESSWTPITKAATWNRVHSVKFLLAHGADPNSHHYSYTGICLTSKAAVADLLYKAGAKIDTAAMGYNIAFGQAEMVKWFLDHGVNPASANAKGMSDTPLFHAGSGEVAELLIQRGVDVNARNNMGWTALHEICAYGEKPDETALVLLNHGADPNARDNNGNTPLMMAKNGATVDVLIKYGADINAKTKDGRTVSEAMPNTGDASKLEALIQHGAAFDPKTDGPTMMMQAAWTNQVDIISALLQKGVDPNQKGTWNKQHNVYMTPLTAAEVIGHYESAKLLVDHGAKIDKQDMSTALFNRRVSIVKLFWEHGAHTISPLTYAISQGASVEELKKLVNQGTPVDSPPAEDSALEEAALLGDLPAIQFLVEKAAELKKVGQPDPKWFPGLERPLQSAATEGQDEIVAYLLQHGAKPNYGDVVEAANNSTPYPDERTKDHFEKTVKLLIDAGALKGISVQDSATVLQSAIFTRQGPGNQAVVKMLLDAGLSLDAPGKDGKTAMQIARENSTRTNGQLPQKELMAFLEQADQAKAAK